MRITTISRLITTALLAVGLMLGGFTASAALIYMNPSAQLVADNTSFSVDILASGLPADTAGGAVDVSWAAASMTLNSVDLATTDDVLFPGPWDPGFTGIDSTGPGSISGLYIGTFDLGVSGNQPIARLNFTLGAGVSNATISMAAAAVGGTWSSYAVGDFTNDYAGATINPVPVPAALWLFGSGLIGLVGVARRRI